jgi:two-component system NarL family sensor kinase
VTDLPAARTASRSELEQSPELFGILVRHAYRGIRVQFLLRGFLLVFMIAAIVAVPPAKDRLPSVLIVIAYGLWTAGLGLWTLAGGIAPVRWMWVALVVDTLALAGMTVLAGASDQVTWTADLLINGFFVIPVLAATQLRPLVCAAVAGSATVAYFAASVATKTANTEPWGSVIVRSLVLVGISAGCVALSYVQLSRVLTIGGLVGERTALLNELVSLEERERTTLAEQLHDGALQYLLAARQDLEDVREGTDADALDRVQFALVESSGLLRETVTQLHPAVLKQAGLGRAVSDLATSVSARTSLAITTDVDDWGEATSSADGLLYGCIRELLTNVVKHAQAHSARVTLQRRLDGARLIIADDGIGLSSETAQMRLAEGHIGLASLRTRVAAASGRLTIAAGPDGTGTEITVDVPLA